MCGIRITAGHGPLKTQDISSGDKNIRVKALEFYKKLFNNMAEMDINLIGERYIHIGLLITAFRFPRKKHGKEVWKELV